MIIKKPHRFHGDHSLTSQRDVSTSIQNTSNPFFQMDGNFRAINDSLEKFPVFLWAHSDLHTVVYNNRLTRKKFGDCRGKLCHKCIMGKENICSCCKTEKILKNNTSEVCYGCKLGNNGHRFDAFHSPSTLTDGSKYVLKIFVDRDTNQKFMDKSKDETETKNISEASILSMCASCKKIKKPEYEWVPVEKYLRDKFGILISHGICRECATQLYPGIDI